MRRFLDCILIGETLVALCDVVLTHKPAAVCTFITASLLTVIVVLVQEYAAKVSRQQEGLKEDSDSELRTRVLAIEQKVNKQSLREVTR